MQKVKQNSSTFNINNRKYLGSKTNLIVPIISAIHEKVEKIETFADLFAGTGVITDGISRVFPSAKLIVNDILYSNYLIYQAFFGCKSSEINLDKISDYLYVCNGKPGYYGYTTHNFGGSYFTIENAKIIDEVRDFIESNYDAKKINFKEKCILLSSLLYSIDKVANTCGQYDSYLKHLGSQTMEDGIHKIDSNVYKKIDMKLPNFNFNENDNLIVSMDANILAGNINAEVVYIDPPYNTRQYIDNYHLLENISRWSKPQVYGKTKKFARDELKSQYSQVRYVKFAFENLMKHLKADHIFLSYNSEGLLSYSYIYEVLMKKGHVSVIELPYMVFGNGAGQSKKREVIEYLFYLNPR